MECSQCKEQIADDSNSCPSCGNSLLADQTKDTAEDTIKTKKRKPFLAAFLSFILPGLGQVYNAQLKRGLVFYSIAFSFPIIFSSIGLLKSFTGLILTLIIGFLLAIYIIVDAYRFAKNKSIEMKQYNKLHIYILLFALSFGLSYVDDYLIGLKSYKIPSGAMLPTIQIGDHILADQRPRNIKRKDLIIFEYPEDPRRDFIKRIVAVGGDVIESINRELYINGAKINEPYITHTETTILPGEVSKRDNFGPITVPENSIYVLGDNRENSHDSRFWGFVDKDAIRGRALYIYWSKDKNRIGMNLDLY